MASYLYSLGFEFLTLGIGYKCKKIIMQKNMFSCL